MRRNCVSMSTAGGEKGTEETPVIENVDKEQFIASKDENGVEEFKCKVCDAIFDQQKKMKQHITMKHRTKNVLTPKRTPKTKEKKRKLSNDDDGPKVVEDEHEFKKPRTLEISALSESFFHEWDPTKTSTQEDANMSEILGMYGDGENEEGRKNATGQGNLINLDESLEESLGECDNNQKIEDLKVELRATRGRVSILQEENEQKVKDIIELQEGMEKLKKDFEVKEDLCNITIAKNHSLEIDNIEKNRIIEKYTNIMKKMHVEVKQLKEEKGQGQHSADVEDLKKKLKKSNESLKSKTKELDEVNKENKALEKNVAEFRSKLSDEINGRAKVESDYIRATKVSKHLEEICRKKGLWDDGNEKENDNGVDREEERRRKRTLSPGSVNEKCRQFEEYGKCRFGKECFRIHPEKMCRFFSRMGECQQGNACPDIHRKEDTKSEKDCTFWLRGQCRFSKEECFNRHDPSKKGMARNSRYEENSGEGNPKTSHLEDNLEKRLDERLKTQENFLAKGMEGIANMVKQISSGQPGHQLPTPNLPGGWKAGQERVQQRMVQHPFLQQQEAVGQQNWPNHQTVEMMDTTQMNQNQSLPTGWKIGQGMDLASFQRKHM